MRAAVKEFIEENIALIEENKWADVAHKAASWLIDNSFFDHDVIEFWKIVRNDLDIDLFKFKDVEVVPSFYCYAADLEEITIPEHILHINRSAFSNCADLRKVVLPKSLYSIQQNAFLDTANLTEIIYNGTKDEFRSRIRISWNAFGTNVLGRNDKKLIAKDGVINL